MKESKYNITINHGNDCDMLYNSLTKSIIKVNKNIIHDSIINSVKIILFINP